MSTGPTPASTSPRWRLPATAVALLIVLLVTAGTVGVRRLGFLQFLEFQAYDFFVRHQVRAPTSDPIVLVELTEDDIQSPTLDWPLDDRMLAGLLRKIEDGQPAVVGLDIWRDMPVPKNGQFSNELNQVFLENTNLVAIFTRHGIAPPAALRDRPEQIAFNDSMQPDIEVDSTIPKVRRTNLMQTSADGTANWDSFAYRVAAAYLEQRGILPLADPTDPKSFLLGKARLPALRSNDGAYVGADPGGWQILIDFKCPDVFERYSVSRVLSGRVPPGAFRDRIVVVGVNTPSVLDDRVTPTRMSHRGMELQSVVINQLLRRALDGEAALQFWSDDEEDAWALLWCACAAYIGLRVRSPWLAAPLAIASFLVLGTAVWVAFDAGLWLPLVAPVAAFIPTGALVTSYMSFREKKDRDQLMQLFARQVSPDIAQTLWEQREEFLAGSRPVAQKLVATVVFTDLEGFSTTSERLDPAALMDWLNEYMEAMAGEVMAHHGVVEKYIGDAIMAVFGVPIARTKPEQIREDARNAVQCALAMSRQMGRLNEIWQARGLPHSGMRIGVHTGTLVAGSIGSVERQEYTVIGDCVNTASRLESYDKDWSDAASPHPDCRILVSEATRQHLDDDFSITRVGTMPLKNKNEPVTIYSVIAPRGGSTPTPGNPPRP